MFRKKLFLSVSVFAAIFFVSNIPALFAAAPVALEFSYMPDLAKNRILVINDSTVDYVPTSSDYTVNINGTNYPVAEIRTGGEYVFLDDFTGYATPFDPTDVITVDDNERVFSDTATSKFLSEGTRFRLKWGTAGTGDGEFNGPRDIDVDSLGNIYVVDLNNNRVQKFGPTGAYITQWGAFGTGNSQFDVPSGITIDSADNIYVADSGNNRIQKFTTSGVYVSQWGTTGTGDGEFKSPSDIAADSAGNLYVVDTNNDRIQKFNSAGTYSAQWGTTGSGNGQFNGPEGIAIDSSDNVYIVDLNNSRVQKFSSTGTYLDQWGTNGTGVGEFDAPLRIAVNSTDALFVTDSFNIRVQEFNSSGTFISQFGTSGTGDGQFDTPSGLIFNASDDLYITDTTNQNIQRFETFPAKTGFVYITESSGSTAATEGGVTDTFTVVLSGEPTDTVTVNLTATGGEVSFDVPALTFTALNWDTPQTVTVTAVNDDIVEGTHSDTVDYAVTSNDTEFDGLSDTAVLTVTITDNDTSGITITESSAATAVTEGGATDTITIVLDSEPTNDVTITFAITGTQVTVSPTTMTFTSANWDTPQTLTVTAVNDNTVEGSHSDTVTYTVVSSDTEYNSDSGTVATVAITDAAVATSRNGGGGINPNKNEIPGWTSSPVSRRAPIICTPYVSGYAEPGKANDPSIVRAIEQFLITYEGEELLVDGIYGDADVAAVKRFQEKYSDEILSFWNLSRGSGYVYITTQRKMNSIACQAEHKAACPAFAQDGYFKLGDQGKDVIAIKQFLNALQPSSAPLDVSSETYDENTVERVKEFQEKFRERILSPWNLTDATGYWYKTTRRVANGLVGCFEPPIRLENGAITE